MPDKERNEAIIGRVKENIENETQSQYGLLEMQSRWAAWRGVVIAMDLSWNNMFQFGDSLIGFALRVVYGTVITPSLKSKWDGDEDGNCKLCLVKSSKSCLVVMKHIIKKGTHGGMIRYSGRFIIRCCTMWSTESTTLDGQLLLGLKVRKSSLLASGKKL